MHMHLVICFYSASGSHWKNLHQLSVRFPRLRAPLKPTVHQSPIVLKVPLKTPVHHSSIVLKVPLKPPVHHSTIVLRGLRFNARYCSLAWNISLVFCVRHFPKKFPRNFRIARINLTTILCIFPPRLRWTILKSTENSMETLCTALFYDVQVFFYYAQRVWTEK